MPPQLKGQKTHKTMWITPGALNMHWIHVTVKCISSPYLAIVAHERNIFAVSRQLVIISLDLILCWIKENCCESFTKPLLTSAADNTASVCKKLELESFCGLCCLRTQMHVELLTKVALLKNSEEVPEVTLWIVTEPWDLCRYSWSVEENEKNVCNITKKKEKEIVYR